MRWLPASTLGLFLLASVVPCSAIDNRNAELALHVQGHQAKSDVCATAEPDFLPCSQYRIEGSVQTGHDVYVVVANADPVGTSGATLAVEYGAATGDGVDVFGWSLCGDTQFPSAGWPASGSSVAVNFASCRTTTVPGGEAEGVFAVLGSFYIYAYSAGMLSLTDLPGGDPSLVHNCGTPSIGLLRTKLGRATFGPAATPPCNPCLEPCAEYPIPPDPSYVNARVDFETPVLTGQDKLLVDPYVDPGTGIVFRNGSDRAIGLVVNSPDISACVDPASRNQLLATGADEPTLGRAAWPIRVELPEPLPGNVALSVTYQTLAGTGLTMQMLAENGALVDEARLVAPPGAGPCYEGGPAITRVALTAPGVRSAPVTTLVLHVDPDGRVFVLDDLVIGESPVRTERSTWGRLKSLHAEP